MTMNMNPLSIARVATLSLATTTILCNDMMTKCTSAFVFSSYDPRIHPAAQHPHRGTMVTGRRRRRLSLSPSSSAGVLTTMSRLRLRRLQQPILIHHKNDDIDSDTDPSDAVQSSNSMTDELLIKARRLRQEISAIESSKLQAQIEKDDQLQAQFAASEAVRQKIEQERLRYSAIVPILKDMGEEVMERVDFPPRVKGGKSAFYLLIHTSMFPILWLYSLFLPMAFIICRKIVYCRIASPTTARTRPIGRTVHSRSNIC